jgi:hypothetical protein
MPVSLVKPLYKFLSESSRHVLVKIIHPSGDTSWELTVLDDADLSKLRWMVPAAAAERSAPEWTIFMGGRGEVTRTYWLAAA